DARDRAALQRPGAGREGVRGEIHLVAPSRDAREDRGLPQPVEGTPFYRGGRAAPRRPAGPRRAAEEARLRREAALMAHAARAGVGVHTAFQDSTPMILFVGDVGSHFRGREAFQEVDFSMMFTPLAKWAARIDEARRIPEFVARAFQVATSGRRGPVVLAL